MRTLQYNYSQSRGSFGIQRIVAAIFGIIQLVLVIRFILKLLGASEDNGFVQGLYGITQPVVGLFDGVFSTINTNIAGIHGVLESATIIVGGVIGLTGWFLFKLISKRSETNHFRIA